MLVCIEYISHGASGSSPAKYKWVHKEYTEKAMLPDLEGCIEEWVSNDRNLSHPGYRGFDYKVLDKPPKEEILEEIAKDQTTIDCAKQSMEYLQKLLDN